MFNRLKTLQARIMLALALIGVLPLAIIGLSVAALDSQALGQQSSRELTGLARGLAGELHIYLNNVLNTSQVIADLPIITNTNPHLAEPALRLLFIHYNQFANLAIQNPDGDLLATAIPGHPPPAELTALQMAANQGRQNWRITAEPDTGHPAFVVYTPIRNAQRQVSGILTSVIDLRDISAIVGQVYNDNGTNAFVLDKNGRVVLHPDHDKIQRQSSATSSNLWLDGAPVGSGTTRYQTDAGMQIAGYAPIPDFGWTVLVERPESEVLAPANRSLKLTLAGLVLSTVAALLTAIYLARVLTRPVRKLAAAAQAFGAGDSSAPLPDLAANDGELGTLVAAFRDMRQAVSERAEALRQSEQRVSLHFQQTPLAAIELGLDMRILKWNPAAENMFGYTSHEAIGQQVNELIVPKQIQSYVKEVEQALLEQRGGLRTTNQNITKTGNIIICEWYNTPLVDPSGQVVAFSSLAQDVTARKQANEKLRRLANRLETLRQIDKAILATHSPQVVATATLTHLQKLIPCQRGSVVTFTDANDTSSAIVLAGYASYQTELGQGQTVYYERPELIEHMRREETFIMANLVAADDLPLPDRILAAEGIRSYLSTPLIASSQLIGILNIGVMQPNVFTAEHVEIVREAANSLAIALQQAELNDQIQQHAAQQATHIAQLQQAEAALVAERASLARRVEERTAELSAANAELARANRLKDEFLAAMSHELRTPLNAILGMAQLLDEQIYGPINQKQLNAVKLIMSSGQHLLSLINDILDLSKIEAGKTDLDLSPVLIPDVCQSSLRMVKQAAYKKQLSVTTTIDNSVTTFLADERRIKQILVNLLSNAVKFTPELGKIGLEVTADDIAGKINFVVWDNGIGIAPEDTTRLFQPFTQLDSRLARKYEGTGLGLALVYHLAKLHSGSVSVTSQLGKGSRFEVSLPLIAVPSENRNELKPCHPAPMVTA